MTAKKAPETTIDPKDIRWRIGSTYDKGNKKMGTLLGYIDARLVMDRLDEKDPSWSSEYTPLVNMPEPAVMCALTVNGVTRMDVGVASDMEPTKGAFSDSLKRAAVHHGIGRELYDLPRIVVECSVKPNGKADAPKALPVFADGRWTIDKQYGWVKYSEVDDEEHKAREEAASVESSDDRFDRVAGDEQQRSRPATDPQHRKMFKMAREAGFDLDSEDGSELFKQSVFDWTGKRSSRDLTMDDMDVIYAKLDDVIAIVKATGGTIQ